MDYELTQHQFPVRMRITLIFILISQLCFGQTTLQQRVKDLSGIWIATDFKQSFDTTHSMISSKKSFDGTVPVGFRFNPTEIKENTWSVGYGELHSHLFHPEVADYTIQGKDTIYEQGNIKIDLNQKDSAGYYPIPSPFIFFADKANTWVKISENQLTLTWKLPGKDLKTIRYTKIASFFEENYLHPNPRDYYVRKITLVGKYKLKDKNGKILSNYFRIHNNGLITGYDQLNGKKIDLSTDVYCGPPSVYDNIMIYNHNNLEHPETEVYIFEKENNIIKLSNYTWNGMKRTITDAEYILERIN